MAQEETREGEGAGLGGGAPELNRDEGKPASDQPPETVDAPPAPPAGEPAAEAIPSEPEYIQQVLQKLLGHIGIRTRIDIVKQDDGYYANIRTKHSNGLLIGRRGQTLRALQYLTRLIVKQHYDDVAPISVDVSGYRQRRENFLRKKGTAVARIVLETHREMALDLLTEKEMEVVVDALKTIDGIRVYAVGTGTRKNVIIAPTH